MTTAMIKQVLKAFGQEGSTETELYLEIPGQRFADGKWLAQLVYFTDTDQLLVYQLIGDYDDGEFVELSSLFMGDQWYIEDSLKQYVPMLVPKGYIEYNGKKYPYREVAASRFDDDLRGMVMVADYELWQAIFDEDTQEAHDIDNSIFYYCDSGFIDNDPTDEEIIMHIKPNI